MSELPRSTTRFDDTMFDVSAVEQGAWVPGPYGPGDERGTFNEVTPEKTAASAGFAKPRRAGNDIQPGGTDE